MLTEDNAQYLRFTGPHRRDKQAHILEGLLYGIAIDGVIEDAEILVLTDWLSENKEHFHVHPFSRIVPMLRRMLADRVLTQEERGEIVAFSQAVRTLDARYDQATSDMQRLQGIVAGIAADAKVSERELRDLRAWMGNHDHLRMMWPFDEIEALAVAALGRGVDEEQTQRDLVLYFNEFLCSAGGRAIDIPESWEPLGIQGVCSVCPEIQFPERRFCFTGSSVRAPRRKISQLVEELGGEFTNRVSSLVSYLIIGAGGNPCWAYGCYGRKVEAAVKLRRQGSRLLLVHENDFWDAVAEEAGSLVPAD